jgi:hypothetical protein
MSDIPPWEAARRGIPWIVWAAAGLVAVILGFTLLYIYVIAPSGNAIDKANQANQLKHDVRQSAIINQENKNVYGSLAYQTSAFQAGAQNLSNIDGPDGLAATRASLPANSGEQAALQASEDLQIRQMCSWLSKVNPDFPSMTAPPSPTMEQVYAANCTAGGPVASPPLDRNPVPDGGA